MDVRLGRRCLAPQVADGETGRARPGNLGGWLELAAVQSHNTPARILPRGFIGT